MCGRTACNISVGNLCAACSYRTGAGSRYSLALWKHGSSSSAPFRPSNNLAPTDSLPVLIDGRHLGAPAGSRVLTPMRWGLVPHFHRGPLIAMRLSTFNGRSEHFLEKSMFARPFRRGQRGVLVCAGYYEWSCASRLPHFVHANVDRPHVFADTDLLTDPPPSSAAAAAPAGGGCSSYWTEISGWTGPALTKMAVIFERWSDVSDVSPSAAAAADHCDESVLSFTVLTQTADAAMTSLHHRMPVFLHTDQQVATWLHARSDSEALGAIRRPAYSTEGEDHTGITGLVFYPVATSVGDSSNKHVSLQPVSGAAKQNGGATDTERRSTKRSAVFLQKWLTGAAKKRHCQSPE